MSTNGTAPHSFTATQKAYSAQEVSIHRSESDCWVILYGNVYDVTDFIQHHPGGGAALSKQGRGGLDVTEHFERIGHTEKARDLLKTLQIGYVDTTNMDKPIVVDVDAAPAANVEEDKEHSVMWHAARRTAILKDHPEVAQLMGSNPYTVVIGLVAVIVHSCLCVYVQGAEVSLYFTVFLAYTLGALCKMYQFAVTHEVCHGTAGSFIEKNSLLKQITIHILTLPSIGGSLHIYYDAKHLGHHSQLGTETLSDILQPSGKKDFEGTIDYATLSKLPFFPAGDGDLISANNFSLGRILEKWGIVKGSELVVPRKYYRWSPMTFFHQSTWLLKCLLVQGVFISEHGFFSAILLGFILLPLPIALCGFCLPDLTTYVGIKLLTYFRAVKKLNFTSHLSTAVQYGCSVSVHAWVWVAFAIYLLAFVHEQVTVESITKGFVYLYLSDLCIYGFGWHPYMGFFLGLHRSGGKGFTTKENAVLKNKGCQPTMSAYSSSWESLITLNLTHHVEHHDFPSVPWNNLPKITQIAPEYYEGLEQSPGFYQMMYKWVQHSEGWAYGCQ